MQQSEYDVVIVGGAFAGASLGLLLKRRRPQTRVLIVERVVKFDKKVGESTSEVSACFLTRILRLTHHLERNHIAKQGLRLWFNDGVNTDPSRCSETGINYQTRLPTFQLDRSVLDEHLLELAAQAGCDLMRPAKLVDWTPQPQSNLLRISDDTGEKEIRARWVVDASGKASWISRKLGHWRRLESHPTNAIWSRFNNVADIDGPEVAERYPAFANAVRCSRAAATNHLIGRGWWSWIIPLRCGEVSLGTTYDPRIFTLPKDGSIAERLLANTVKHPIGKLLFEKATPVEGDQHAYGHLPYYSEKIASEAWCCVGDAAGFMDPLYSQGLDFVAYTVCATLPLICKALDGLDVGMQAEKLSAAYVQSCQRWQASLYHDKYQYLGDAELMNTSFLLDLSCYFIGPVRLVHDDLDKEFTIFPYSDAIGARVGKFMQFYNRRLAVLAQRRLASGCYGRRNVDWRFLVRGGFAPDTSVLKTLRTGLWHWLKAEAHGCKLPRVTKAEPMNAGAVTLQES